MSYWSACGKCGKSLRETRLTFVCDNCGATYEKYTGRLLPKPKPIAQREETGT